MAIMTNVAEKVIHKSSMVDLVLHAQHLHGLPQLLLLVGAQLLPCLSFLLLSPFAWDHIKMISPQIITFLPLLPSLAVAVNHIPSFPILLHLIFVSHH